MGFEFNSAPGPRPSSHWNNTESGLRREFSPLHQHEFGLGGDVLYKDSFGNVQGRLDGLSPKSSSTSGGGAAN